VISAEQAGVRDPRRPFPFIATERNQSSIDAVQQIVSMSSKPSRETGLALRHLWILALVASIAMRLFALMLAAGVAHAGDPGAYLNLAQGLDMGRGLALPRTEQALWLPTAQYPPGLPVLLAGVNMLFPLTATTLCIVNSAIDVAAALLLGRLATQLGRPDIALPVGLAYLLWPSIALMAPLAYKEGLVIALLLAALVALLEQARRGGTGWAALSGAAAGAVILTQPAVTPFLALAFIALKPCFGRSRDWYRASVIAAACATLLLVPWWVRNWVVFDAFVPLTTSSGLALWQGAHPAGGMHFEMPPAAWAKMGELAAAQAAQSAAWHMIMADPLGYVQRCLLKLPASFFKTNWAVDQLVFAKGQPFPQLARSVMLRLGPTVVELCVVILTLFGLFRFPRSPAARLVWAALLHIMTFAIWFEFSERHRALLVPFMLLMVATLLTKSRRSAQRSPDRFAPARTGV
jgi:4-amino-4-deoxy-L-arabinose transferase-like glycosyltransferase